MDAKADSMEGEHQDYEPTETELTLYYLSSMLDTLISQLMWMREIVEQELDRIADEE